ncbi:nitroreductase family deazaflavin-dependent oxidoreductase [Amycolatopsis sp. OK19-0408]|uniref:Nitroreductase family deazaflavin-dependent oxidoreductase n=1 Tax=Amycolatopsis iheyensis TaxID=2945988 RepID=A0A9X2NIP5_9PSEU|nr:nitroreductase family deazaflavin-dependent oxidoreductase [Amycolatopsis iheyensis]MCR6488028.1 nitroreductase family deazaflavin-dependent oxidoreductase [Amycolatopsis iheyensis]
MTTADVRETNRRVIRQFRAGGEVDGMHRERLVLLTTTGRTTGEPRTVPMMYHRDGTRLLVVASNIGAPRHPDWYLNLIADPRVTVEVDGATFEAEALPLLGADYVRMWTELETRYPFFADHQAKARQAKRVIPIVELSEED